MRPIENNFAFIDSQNLNLAILRQGWSLDFQKFRRYLANKYQVRKAYLFLGYIRENQRVYTHLRREGYKLIFKPISQGKNGRIKGNVDAELVLQAAINYKKYDKAVIVSGDGDFNCLVKHLARRDKIKQLIIPNQYKYSRLLSRSFIGPVSITFMNELKHELQRIK